jgi:hypothetical protein
MKRKTRRGRDLPMPGRCKESRIISMAFADFLVSRMGSVRVAAQRALWDRCQ